MAATSSRIWTSLQSDKPERAVRRKQINFAPRLPDTGPAGRSIKSLGRRDKAELLSWRFILANIRTIATGAAADEPDATVGKMPLSDAQLDAASGGLTFFIKEAIRPSDNFPIAWQLLADRRGA